MAHLNVLKVAIDVGVNPATAGGIAQVIIGLVKALGELSDETERYALVVQSPSEMDYLRPYVGANRTFVTTPHSFKQRATSLARRTFGRLSPTVDAVYK